MFQFLSPWGLNQGRYVCECSMHTSDPHGAMALQMLPLPHCCVFLCLWLGGAQFFVHVSVEVRLGLGVFEGEERNRIVRF